VVASEVELTSWALVEGPPSLWPQDINKEEQARAKRKRRVFFFITG
jgi:hypothetical protein